MTELLQAETWSPVFTPRRVKAVDSNSFHLLENETLGLVGESDSGKTVASLPIMRLIGNPGRIEKGRIIFQEEDFLEKSEREMCRIRGG